MSGLEQLIDPALVTDVIDFVRKHPVLSAAVAAWASASEGLPFVKRIRSSGVLHLAWNLAVTGARLILKLNTLNSGKDGKNVGTGS